MLDIARFREGKFKADRIGYALRGENPTMIARVNSGFIFLMDVRACAGKPEQAAHMDILLFY